jgi:F420-dependent oxidoreductase-like protein
MGAQIGIMIEGQDGLNWERWKRILTTAESVGYQCVFRSDHFIIGEAKDSLELWISLTYAATHTSRIEFGSLVTPITFRHPSMNARYAAQIDDLSGGRLVYGVGAGWHEDEHVRWGVPFYDFPQRYRMLTDTLEITKRLFETDEAVIYDGEAFQLQGATLLPRPQRVGGPPILIGGNGPKRTLPLVAQYAREWNAVFIDRETYRERTVILNELLAEQGRQPTDVKRSLMTRVEFGRDNAAVKVRLAGRGVDAENITSRGGIVGTSQQVVDQIGAWVDAGVERFMLQWMDLDDIDGLAQMAADVLPHFHTD